MTLENLTLANIEQTRKAILELPQSVERAKLLIENDVCLINYQEIEHPFMTVTSDELILDSIVPETAGSLAGDAVQASLDAMANFNLPSHDWGELGKPSIIDAIVAKVTNFHKDNRKPHFIFLGKLEIQEMMAKLNFRIFPVKFEILENDFIFTMERKSRSFGMSDRLFYDCIVIEYPADSFLEVF
jgi:hypothetical protein